jgi:F420 biosynthesis protein FbiB-like protein
MSNTSLPDLLASGTVRLSEVESDRTGFELGTPSALSWPDLVMTRRSIRRFRPEAIEKKVLEKLLAHATWAPSAHNRQPWRFAFVAQSKRRTLADAMAARLRRDRLADGDDPNSVEADVARSAARLTDAPSLLLVSLTMADMDRYPDERRSRAEFLMAVQSTAMAVQNLLLGARSEGLGSCILCAPLFCPDAVLEALDLPEDWAPQCLVVFGWPASAGKVTGRKAVSEVLAPPHIDANVLPSTPAPRIV